MHDHSENRARPAVLLVEDSRTTKVMLARHLAEHYLTVEAGDGEEAWDILQTTPKIELVITDLHMPRLDGQELLLRIRSSDDPRIKRLPVIVMTAADENADKHLAFSNGANDFVYKPVDAIELQARVGVHYALARTIRELEESRQTLAALAATDPLTGLKNRRTFGESCAHAIANFARYSAEFSVLFIDVDHFKRINDVQGHAAGDRVLVDMARLLEKTLRNVDAVARIGGEEFGVLLPNTNRLAAAVIAERIRFAVEHAEFENATPVTVSIGLATWGTEGVTTIEELMAVADQRVYLAKKNGRNRICVNDTGRSTFSAAVTQITFE
jgi:two-component system cell cycle response regulator